jgi:hypothetical protein
MGEINLSEALRKAIPRTPWLYTEGGVRYRWVELDKETITVLRELVQDRAENTESLACSSDSGK